MKIVTMLMALKKITLTLQLLQKNIVFFSKCTKV